MKAPGRETALARLELLRNRIERELARVERKITRASRQVFAIKERIASLTPNHRRAA